MDTRWSEAELAYLAGIIDGEGSFSLKTSGSHRMVCHLGVGNTDIRMMDWLSEHFGGSVICEKRPNPTHKPVWRWYPVARDLNEIVLAVMPFLVLKRDRAELFMAYRNTLNRVSGDSRSTRKITDSVKGERQRIRGVLLTLNKRGVA